LFRLAVLAMSPEDCTYSRTFHASDVPAVDLWIGSTYVSALHVITRKNNCQLEVYVIEVAKISNGIDIVTGRCRPTNGFLPMSYQR
jgi:hypothetical protein